MELPQRLSFMTIGARNLESMRNFYVEQFGWTPIKDDDGIVFFAMNGFILGLFPADELAGDIGITNDGAGFKRLTMAINLRSEAEVDACFEKLAAKGVKIVLPPEKVFWGGYRGYLADVEDNYWEIAFNPFLALDEWGNSVSHQ